ncbi:MAG TPA: NUDIX hydrolase [Spirochaetota bacterium]|nr:NUDIX hydrolase [Spirochaetota bacterium]
MNKWHIRGKDKIFENRIFTIHNNNCHHPDKGVEWDFSIIDTYNWINVIALTEDNRFVLVKQHRLGSNELSIETPGGVIEDGEDPEACALREFREETGYEGQSIHLLKSLWVNPAIMSNRISFYFIEGCRKSSAQQLDEAEDIEVITPDIDELVKMIKTGEINHSIVMTGLGLYFLSEFNRFGQVVF